MTADMKPDSLNQSIQGCLESVIGTHGLTQDSFDRWLAKVWPHVERLQDDYRSGDLPLLRIADDTEDLDAAEAALTKLSEGADALVFFGTGGSGLGGQTLAQVGGWNLPGNAWGKRSPRPRTRFFDNLDGRTLGEALAGMDFSKTRFIVTSKSGGTAETLAQAIAAISAVKAAGMESEIPKLFLGITEPDKPGKKNGLRDLFVEHGIPMLDHPVAIGGRFSCLTIVGLIPALARGMDARAVRAGAAEVISELLAAKSPADVAPAVGAATTVALSKDKGIGNIVMMPYNDRLARFSAWFVQLWAESLGKGGEGTSPIATTGPLDQHSQLQLFMDGPRTHMINIVRVVTAGTGPKLDAELARLAGAEPLAGKTVGDIVSAQSHAIAEALGQAGRPVRTFDLSTLDEKMIGRLLMHFMIETILAGRLLDLDPFDQPAVELAKVLTRERLSGKS